MSLTLERPAQRSQPRQIVAWVLGTVLLVATFVPAMRALEDMPRADVTFINRTRWDIHVDLLLDDGRSRVGLGTLGTGKTVRIQEIGEPGGDEWTFEFAAWDETAEVTVSDQSLRADRYRVAVPDALIERLEAAPRLPAPTTDVGQWERRAGQSRTLTVLIIDGAEVRTARNRPSRKPSTRHEPHHRQGSGAKPLAGRLLGIGPGVARPAASVHPDG